jgi:hypothetical protein
MLTNKPQINTVAQLAERAAQVEQARLGVQEHDLVGLVRAPAAQMQKRAIERLAVVRKLVTLAIDPGAEEEKVVVEEQRLVVEEQKPAGALPVTVSLAEAAAKRRRKAAVAGTMLETGVSHLDRAGMHLAEALAPRGAPLKRRAIAEVAA